MFYMDFGVNSPSLKMARLVVQRASQLRRLYKVFMLWKSAIIFVTKLGDSPESLFFWVESVFLRVLTKSLHFVLSFTTLNVNHCLRGRYRGPDKGSDMGLQSQKLDNLTWLYYVGLA